MTSPCAAARTANNGAATALPLPFCTRLAGWTPSAIYPKPQAKAIACMLERLLFYSQACFESTRLEFCWFLPFYDHKRIPSLWRAAAHAHFVDIAWLPAEQRSPCFHALVNSDKTKPQLTKCHDIHCQPHMRMIFSNWEALLVYCYFFLAHGLWMLRLYHWSTFVPGLSKWNEFPILCFFFHSIAFADIFMPNGVPRRLRKSSSSPLLLLRS